MSGNTVHFTGDDIAAAFGMPLPSTTCRACGHRRRDHRRILDPDWDPSTRNPYLDKRNDTYAQCERRDRRRTTTNRTCPCVGFVEPRLGEDESHECR